jgi:hypothetical protein
MERLIIPRPLEVEFATLEAIWHSAAETRRVDAMVLAWIKYEKQLRRLFCFLVFQHPRIGAGDIDQVIAVMAANRKLYPDTFIKGIDALGPLTVRQLLGSQYGPLSAQIRRIKDYRNKLIHGQVTGQKITSKQLEKDVLWIIQWVHNLATSADSVFGYDGLRRNTYRAAKSGPLNSAQTYPFSNTRQFKSWLNKLT